MLSLKQRSEIELSRASQQIDHLYNQAYQLVTHEEHLTALEILQKAIVDYPTDGRFFKLLGYLLLLKNELKLSESILRQALILSPRCPETLTNLGVCLMKQNLFLPATEILQRALQEKESGTLLKNLGLCLIKLNQISKGLSYLQRASNYLPDDPHLKHDIESLLLAVENSRVTNQ